MPILQMYSILLSLVPLGVCMGECQLDEPNEEEEEEGAVGAVVTPRQVLSVGEEPVSRGGRVVRCLSSLSLSLLFGGSDRREVAERGGGGKKERKDNMDPLWYMYFVALLVYLVK